MRVRQVVSLSEHMVIKMKDFIDNALRALPATGVGWAYATEVVLPGLILVVTLVFYLLQIYLLVRDKLLHKESEDVSK